MRLEYYPETDMLYIHLRDGPGADAQEVAPGVVIDLDAASRVVGIEIERASQHTDVRNVHSPWLRRHETSPRSLGNHAHHATGGLLPLRCS